MSEDTLNGTSSKEFLLALMEERDKLLSVVMAERFTALEKLWTAQEVAGLKLEDERDRRYTEKFAAKGDAIDIAAKAAKEATDRASFAVERRLEALDALRVGDSEALLLMLPKAEYDRAHAALIAAITAFQERQAQAHQDLIDRTNDKVQTLTTALQGVKDETAKQLGRVTWWLIGLLGGVVVALFMALIGFILNG